MKTIIYFFIAVFIAGCSTVSGLDRIKALSLSRDEQEATIEKQDQEFKQLLNDFSSGKLEKGTSKDKVIQAYGEPILIKEIKNDSSTNQEWMYRHPAQFFGSEKVFLYFNSKGELVDSRYVAQN
jgi:hypothetical protein